ncbi:MAG TPA: hypothetical protein VIO11_10125, partial [Candidatus Methanoperedens sp.]
VYGNDINNKGIAIQSTLQRLRQSFGEELKLEQYIREIKYIDLDDDDTNSENITIRPFFRKSKEYDDEHEIRALIQIIDPKEWSLYNERILIPVRLDELIENIYLSPHASEDTYNSVQDVVKKYGLKIPVKLPRKKPMEGKSNEVSLYIRENSGNDPSGNMNFDVIKGVFEVIGQNKH